MNDLISFESEGVSFQPDNIEKLALWIERVVAMHHRYPGNITFIFCSDDYLWEMNKQHLNHDSLTDVITFNYNIGAQISGDIFISIDRIKDNALMYKKQTEEELRLVMAHGVLHLLDFNDKTIEESKTMRAAELKALAIWDSL
jgi:rRNA maturation RNase YbeY